MNAEGNVTLVTIRIIVRRPLIQFIQTRVPVTNIGVKTSGDL